MIICHITTVHNIKDNRILYKQCCSLAKNNNTVYLIGSYEKDTVLEGVNIISLPFPTSRHNRMIKNTFLALFQALKIKASVYHIHDPELIFCGLALKLRGYRVIYDVHELVCEDISTKNWIKPFFLKKVLIKSYKIIETIAVKFLDAIILAEEGYIPYFKKYKKSQHKIHIVRNFPLPKKRLVSTTSSALPGNKKFIYVGGLGVERGVKEIIQAIALVESAELWLLGRWESNKSFEECQALSGWEKTRYLGECSPQKVPNYLSSADFGLCILNDEKNFSVSSPVKSFEYMLYGLPMIMSNFPLWKQFYENCALFVNPLDIKKIAEAMETLLKDTKLVSDMKKECFTKVQKYCWEHEEKTLLNIYKKLDNI